MKATIDLPDHLVKQLKLRAVHESRTLKDLVAELLTDGLSRNVPTTDHRVEFPLVRTRSAESDDDEATPERIAEVLFDLDAEHS